MAILVVPLNSSRHFSLRSWSAQIFWARKVLYRQTLLLVPRPHPGTSHLQKERTGYSPSQGDASLHSAEKIAGLLESGCDLGSIYVLRGQQGAGPPHLPALYKVGCRRYRLFFPDAWTYSPRGNQRHQAYSDPGHAMQTASAATKLRLLTKSILFSNRQHITVRRSP